MPTKLLHKNEIKSTVVTTIIIFVLNIYQYIDLHKKHLLDRKSEDKELKPKGIINNCVGSTSMSFLIILNIFRMRVLFITDKDRNEIFLKFQLFK